MASSNPSILDTIAQGFNLQHLSAKGLLPVVTNAPLFQLYRISETPTPLLPAVLYVQCLDSLFVYHFLSFANIVHQSAEVDQPGLLPY